MRKLTLLIASIMFLHLSANAQSAQSDGDGTTYSFERLSQMPGSGVTKQDGIYVMTGSYTIAEGDSFKIDDGVVVEFSDDAELVLKGRSDLRSIGQRTTLRRHGSSTSCMGIHVQNDQQVTEVGNLLFEHVGLRGSTTKGMNVSDCSFIQHNGNVSSALFLGSDDAMFTIKHCTFDHCEKAAIGGAANFFCPVTIEDCTFTQNSQSNGNIPQLNLTVASEVTIRNCKVYGDSTLTMVGGIAIANWYGTSGHHATITNCDIRDNRYGITTMGVMDVTITDNQIVNNKFELNPNNGGSGISLYDPYLKQTALISGNRIEKSLWGITIIGCGDVNLGKTEVSSDSPSYNPGNNVFVDNGNSGMLYDLYNNSTNTVYAQGNLWNVTTQDAASIEEVIFHKADNDALGEVIFMPAGSPTHVKHAIPQPNGTENHIFRMDGTRVNGTLRHLPKGIYIINGKKVII